MRKLASATTPDTAATMWSSTLYNFPLSLIGTKSFENSFFSAAKTTPGRVKVG